MLEHVTLVGGEQVVDHRPAAMQGAHEMHKRSKSCPCCDTQSKAACPDFAACLAKCSTSVLAVLVPEQGMCLNVVRHVRPADPEKPPDWACRPPSPPPKA